MRSASASRSGRLRPSGGRENHNRGSKIAHSQFVISPHARIGNWQGSSELTSPFTTSSAKNPSDHLARLDRKSTRLNSSHTVISYAVFCLKKKKKNIISTSNINSSNYIMI